MGRTHTFWSGEGKGGDYVGWFRGEGKGKEGEEEEEEELGDGEEEEAGQQEQG